MKATQAIDFTRDWTRAWRTGNVAALISNFAATFRFTAFTSTARVDTRDRATLHRFWRAACRTRSAQGYVLDHTVFDLEDDVLTIYYAIGASVRALLASDHLIFDDQGFIVRAEINAVIAPSQVVKELP